MAFVALCTLAAPALAQEGEKILLWRAASQGAESSRTAAAAARFKEEAGKLLGPRLIGEKEIEEARAKGTLEGLENCVTQDVCLRKLGQVFQADRVVAATIVKKGREVHVAVTSVPVSGGQSARVTKAISAEGVLVPRMIRMVVARTLSPADYSGTLVLTGLKTGDQVLVDTLPVRTAPPSHQLRLSVGKHRLEIFRGDKAPVETQVEMDFEETNVFDVKAAMAPPPVAVAKPGKPPVWPLYASVGVAVVGLAIALPFAVDMVVVGAQLTEEEGRLGALSDDQRSPNNSEDPLGQKWQGYGGAADRKAVWVALGTKEVQVRRQAFLIDTIMTTTGGVLVAAGLGGTLFFASQVFAGDPEEGPHGEADSVATP
jgi:hypothetical protein